MIALMCFTCFSAVAQSRETITLSLTQKTLAEIFKEFEKQVPYSFLYRDADLVSAGRKDLNLTNATLRNAMDACLRDSDLEYEIVRDQIIIRRRTASSPGASTERPVVNVITGTVTDAASGNPMVGATVVIEGSSTGAITDTNGAFTIRRTGDQPVNLAITFVGYHRQVVRTDGSRPLAIALQEDAQEIDQVVVLGLITQNRNSFTGSVTSMTGEEIKAVSNTNLISAIAMLTPGLRIMENEAMGSNPNELPEIIIRGTSSLALESDVSPNQPLIILDGVPITLRDLYDIDINEIERVDVLKDASATSLYGERAANGVITILRKSIPNARLRFSYSMDGDVTFPDLSSYDYLGAADKLRFELLSGLYDLRRVADLEEYSRKQMLIASGVNTNWMAKPLRTGVNLGHSFSVSGRSENFSYRVGTNLRNIKGVMKGDYRDNLGLNIFLSYNIDRKITVSLQNRYTNTKSKNSPFGTFSTYAALNPYDSPYGADGTLIRRLSWDMVNPIHEAECGNFSKSGSQSFANNLSVRWDIMNNLYLTALGSVTVTDQNSRTFRSPLSSHYDVFTDPRQKGSLTESYLKGVSRDANFVLNYNLNIGNNLLAVVNAGGEIAKDDSKSSRYESRGFYKPELNTTGFAAMYPPSGAPDGNQDLSTRIGLFGNINVIAYNKYFVNASLRRSGSSQFGANNRYAPFWSLGGGWNVHNEEIFRNQRWIDMLRLRCSYGVTGSVMFAPYQAITTYRYDAVFYYLHGIGAVPRQMGNDDLSWQSTRSGNIGVNADLWNGRISFSFDYYVRTTDDLLIDLTIPPSVGESSVKKNLGKIRNSGYELDVALRLVNTADWRANLKFNGAYNNNRILKISNALQARNDENNANPEAAPRILYVEGQSTTAIYAVHSAGINPANGREVFITRYGAYTMDYDVDDKVVVGDTNPRLEGSIFPVVAYKRLSLNLAMYYRFGGQVYNITRARNVENVNPRFNVDRRALDQRWKNINDVVNYLDIADGGFRTENRHTSRFVENDNVLEVRSIQLSYEFAENLVRHIGFKRLRVGLGMLNPVRFSTVKYERGTSYPFSHGVSFTISPTF